MTMGGKKGQNAIDTKVGSVARLRYKQIYEDEKKRQRRNAARAYKNNSKRKAIMKKVLILCTCAKHVDCEYSDQTIGNGP